MRLPLSRLNQVKNKAKNIHTIAGMDVFILFNSFESLI